MFHANFATRDFACDFMKERRNVEERENFRSKACTVAKTFLSFVTENLARCLGATAGERGARPGPARLGARAPGPSASRSGARGAAGAPREFRQLSSSCLKEKARFPPQITPFFRSFAFFFLGPGGREKSDFMQFRKVEAAPLAENLAKKTCI